MASAARVAKLAAGITTGNVARLALGQGLTDLSAAYTKVQGYNPSFLGISLPHWATAWDPLVPVAYVAAGGTGDPSQVAAVSTEYLDGIRTRAQSDFAALPTTDDPLDSATASQIAFDIGSIETATGVINQTLNQSALQDLADSTTDVLKGFVPSALKPLLEPVPWYVYLVAGLVVLALFWHWWRD
jgi:hypothetical protein